MIKERYVSSEIDKLLKEKGMDKNCFTHYMQQNNNDGTSEAVTTCTHQMALDWLRKVHGIHIHIHIELGVREDKPDKYVNFWRPVIQGMFNTKHFRDINEKARQHFAWKFYDDYAKAVDDAIEFTLKNLI